MSKRNIDIFYFDILIGIYKIELVSSKFLNAEELLHDFISWDSVIREFEIIGEATKILLNNSRLDESFRVIVDFRNLITHQYFGIDSEAVWSIIQSNIKQFHDRVVLEINNLEKPLFQELYESALKDNLIYKEICSKLTTQFIDRN